MVRRGFCHLFTRIKAIKQCRHSKPADHPDPEWYLRPCPHAYFPVDEIRLWRFYPLICLLWYFVSSVKALLPQAVQSSLARDIKTPCYDYWCIALKTGRFSIPELHVLLDAISATTTDFPDLIPDDSDRTRSFSMEFSRALLQHFLHASWRYEHLTEEYLIVIDVDISVPACCITNGGVPDV